MSARLSDGAYAILEKSFRNANIPKPLESVGHRGDDIPFKRPVPGTFFDPANMTDDETISESSASIHDGHDDFTPHFSLSRHGSGLPPTPPTRSHGSPDLDHLSPRPLFADGVRASLQPQKSGLSTPVHHRSPPTPEFTPPTTRDKLAPPRPGLHHYPSSQADSFVTAREAQSASSQNNSQVHLPIDDHGPNNFLDATRSMRLANIGLGVDVPGLENGGGLTVTRESNLDERFGQNIIAPKQAEPQEKVLDEEEGKGLDTNLLRNVTVRKRRPKQPHLDTSAAQTLSTPKNASPLTRKRGGGSLRERVEKSQQSPRSASTEKFGEEIEWPSAANDMLYTHLRDEKSKRLSSMSGSSTVIEAVVISTPPQRRRTLRHAGKNLALREDLSTSSKSARSSLDSSDTFKHTLKHRKSPIPDRKSRLGIDGAASPSDRRVTSEPEPVLHRPIPVIVIPERRSSLLFTQELPILRPLRRRDAIHLLTCEQDTTASVPINAERLPRLPKTAHLESDSRAREVREGSTDSVESGQLSFPSADRDGQLRHASAPIRLTQATPSKQSRETNKDLHGLASEKPVLASIPLSGRSAEGSRGRSFDSSRSAIDQKASIEIKRPPNKLGVGERRRSNTSSERSPVARRESNPPWTSSDGLSPSSPRRKHIDPRMDSRLDSAGSHIGYPNTTPMSFSQLSDRTDALEVSEATAISIYPHNNNSLLVVQQVARSNSNATTRKPTLATTNLPTITNGGSESDEQTPVQPIFSSAIIPSTPPARKVEMLQVDSPLKNPRAAPAPPAIKFIPPTPSEEADKQLQLVPYKSPPDSHESTSPDRPVRRLSLVQKARRYSESFVQPFLGRSLSTKSRSRYATHRISRPDLEQRDVNLHPFWRPRGFWDDFSSDSEDFLDYEEPLPRGGDTSDTGYDDAHAGKGGNNGSNGRWKPRMMSVRMKGFRGSGGFLVGNSLGLDRHGTNKRRHYVDVPLDRGVVVAEGRGVDGSDRDGANRGGPQHGLRKRKSEEMLRTLTASAESLRRASGRGSRKRRHTHRVPGLGFEVQYLGLKGFREKMRQVKVVREEREREKRRQEIRGSIGARVYHESAVGRRLE